MKDKTLIPLTRDEKWKAEIVGLLEEIRDSLKPQIKMPDLTVEGIVKTEVKKPKTSKKKEVK